MPVTPSTFRRWHAPNPTDVGKDHIEFLRILNGPTWITMEGIDQSRQRAIVTLLHGNEPSGLKAVHKFLLGGEKPATNLGIFVISVNAALFAPMMSHRSLPEEQDINRCFRQKASSRQKASRDDSNQALLAASILTTLKAFAPEAIIDTHNTSAHSDPFAVAISDQPAVQQIAQMFVRRLVILDITLGTLIEQDLGCPVVTVEFGGILDPKADVLAAASIESFIESEQLFKTGVLGMQVLKHPLRLEIDQTSKIHYSASVQDNADITIFNTIDQMNFMRVEAGTNLGWLGTEQLKPLRVVDQQGIDICHQLFAAKDGFLVNQVPMTLFMATTDPHIASNDCLLYLCRE